MGWIRDIICVSGAERSIMVGDFCIACSGIDRDINC
jgi:hypothetical protein